MKIFPKKFVEPSTSSLAMCRKLRSVGKKTRCTCFSKMRFHSTATELARLSRNNLHLLASHFHCKLSSHNTRECIVVETRLFIANRSYFDIALGSREAHNRQTSPCEKNDLRWCRKLGLWKNDEDWWLEGKTFLLIKQQFSSKKNFAQKLMFLLKITFCPTTLFFTHLLTYFVPGTAYFSQ